LDAARLHPAPGQHLRLDHHRPADLLGRPARLLGGLAEAVLGDGDARQLDDLPRLVLVEPHQRRATLSNGFRGWRVGVAWDTAAGETRRGGSALSSSASCVLVASIGLLALFLAGCGGTVIDQVKAEDTIQASLEDSLHEKIKAVDCPAG